MEALIEELIKQNTALMSALKITGKEPNTKVSGVQFEKFDDSNESFDSFIERFEAFLDIQGVSDEKRGKTLISSLSAKLYNLLKNLLSPDHPADKDFDELKKILKNHLNPKPLMIPSRHLFLNRKQNEGESISSYMAELRSLAIPCSYKQDMLNIMLRDVFVSGLRDKHILDRLFEEDDIDLNKTLAIALALEKAVKGANEVIGPIRKYSINELSMPKRNSNSRPVKSYVKNESSENWKNACTRCSQKGHKASDCKHINSICNYCKKKGHIAPACFSARKANKTKQKPQRPVVNQKQVNFENADETCDLKEPQAVPMFSFDSNYSVDTEIKNTPIMINLEIEDKPVKMELDTGAAVSAMSYKNFKKISRKYLQPTNVLLKTYKGETIVPLGCVNVKVQYGSQSKTVNLYIVKENLDTIFGREWLYQFQIDWNFVKSLKSTVQKTSHEAKLSELISKYKMLFDDEYGTIKDFECQLQLKENVKPVFFKSRTVPFALKDRVEKEIDNLESEGIIEKIKFSEWATPVVPVVKPDGSIRLCADYSVTLNPNLKMQHHPLPKLEEIFTCLNGGDKFSKVDFSKAYLQIKVHPDSQKLLTINTHKGLYVCKRLMYGLNVAPAIWQSYIDSIFHGMEGTKVFMDDARITGPDNETHLKRLELFFERCKQQGLKINLKKSKFFQKEISFLGHKIDATGLKKTDEKVEAILNAPEPKNVQEVKSFLGLVNFYGRFCRNLSTMAYPLNELTKKEIPWKWSVKCQEAFKKIKEEICSDRVLIHYDPSLPVVLATDASAVGLGAVLSHRLPNGDERPIAFASKTLSRTEQRYSQIDKEALGIHWGVKKFYLYLKGRRFTLITDHKPLTQIYGSKKGLPVLSATRLLHYALHLQAYQFDIQYRNTKDHGNADFLSRLPVKSEDIEVIDDIAMFQISQIETLPITAKDLAKATITDEELGPLLQDLKSGEIVTERAVNYTLESGCILYGARVCVPKCYQKQVLNELHVGHLGVVKMKAIARSYVYWKNIDKDIEELARNCVDCTRIQTNPRKVEVHHWEYPSSPWERVHIDFAGPFYEHMFLIIVDAHSKWLEAYPMKNITSHATIECLRDCFARFGIPVTLVSDNGSQLVSEEFERFLKMNGIQHKTCAPYKPSSNGQAERYVFTVKQSLRAVQNYPGSIRQKLATFLLQYRKSPNATTQQSPAMLLMKRELRTRIDLLRPNLKKEVEERVRKGKYTFNDREVSPGDRVAVRNYRDPDSKWKIGTVISRDGQLHYTVKVNNQLWRRHIDQIREAGDQVQSSEPVIPRMPLIDSTVTTSTLPTKTADDPAENSSDPPETCPETQPVTCSQADKPCSSPAVENVPNVPRRSGRIRKAPQRLNL